MDWRRVRLKAYGMAELCHGSAPVEAAGKSHRILHIEQCRISRFAAGSGVRPIPFSGTNYRDSDLVLRHEVVVKAILEPETALWLLGRADNNFFADADVTMRLIKLPADQFNDFVAAVVSTNGYQTQVALLQHGDFLFNFFHGNQVEYP